MLLWVAFLLLAATLKVFLRPAEECADDRWRVLRHALEVFLSRTLRVKLEKKELFSFQIIFMRVGF